MEINKDKYKFTIGDDINYKLYSCDSYSGIIFIDKCGCQYDIVNNPFLGYRLLINNQNGWKDVPFNKNTFDLLPVGVKVTEI